MKHLAAVELAERLNSDGERPTLLDVREPWEVELVSLPGSLCIPMQDIAARAGELPTDRPIVCVCHHGMRSMQVATFLEHSGLDDVYNLTGGIDAWARQVDPTCAVY